MADAAPEKAAESDIDHGLGDVDALFVVADRPAPARHPGEAALDGPAPRQPLEAGLCVDAARAVDAGAGQPA